MKRHERVGAARGQLASVIGWIQHGAHDLIDPDDDGAITAEEAAAAGQILEAGMTLVIGDYAAGIGDKIAATIPLIAGLVAILDGESGSESGSAPVRQHDGRRIIDLQVCYTDGYNSQGQAPNPYPHGSRRSEAWISGVLAWQADDAVRPSFVRRDWQGEE